MKSESQNTEYKEQWHDEYLKWICGFANAQGGHLIVGVNDRLQVVGLNDSKKLMEDIPNKVRDVLGIMVDVNLLHEAEMDYIDIKVHESTMPITYKGKYYYRSGSTMQELGGLALNDFLLRKMNLSWDATPQPHASMEDLDRAAIDYFLQCAIDAKRLNANALHATTEQVMNNLNLLDSQGRLTMAAMLLFGKDILKWCSSAQFRIGRFGNNVADLITQDAIACPLVLMPDRIIEVLRSKYLHTPIHYKGLLRMEPLEIPEDGLREMLCNAIVHRNYMGADTQMKVFNDRITLWNDGTLPDNYTIETLMGEHESKPRNKLIAKVFYLAGFIETWGRGYEKIKNAFETEGLEVPTFEQLRGGMAATIKRERFVATENVASSSENDMKNVMSSAMDYTKVFVKENESKLTERQKDILFILANDNTLNSRQIADRMSRVLSRVSQKDVVSYRTIQRDLNALVKNGIIRHEGGRQNGYWRLLFMPSSTAN